MFEELDEEGRDALFSFFFPPVGSIAAKTGTEITGVPMAVGDPDSVSGDETPLLAPMAVHHFPE